MGREFDIRDRTVLITGGAHGIGAEAARQLAAAGANVALMDRDADGVERMAGEIGAAATCVAGDVTQVDDLERAITDTVERRGGIDVVIANAGISGSPMTVRAMDPDEFERVVAVDLVAVYHTVRLALPHVIERRGYVLPIASVAAVLPVPLQAAYAASKAGVENFSRSLGFELAHTGVKVGVGYFGFIDTQMVRTAFESAAVQAGRTTMPAFMSRPLPVSAAGRAIVRGVRRRARHIYAPRWVPLLFAARGMLHVFGDLPARDPRFVRSIRIAEAELAERERPGAPV
jgi:NAD(P)-dependent dehydrogenase (short-subunit alcohol dehydrogenase family)